MNFFCAMTASLSCVLDKFIYLAGMLIFHGINLSEQAALIMQKHAVLPEVISTVGGT